MIRARVTTLVALPKAAMAAPVATFHTSAVAEYVRGKKGPPPKSRAALRQESLTRVRKNLARKFNKAKEEEAAWIDPVLGVPGNAFIQRIDAMSSMGNNQLPGFKLADTEALLFGSEVATMSGVSGSKGDVASKLANKREAVNRILSLRNGNSADILKHKIRLAREEFERFPGDTGSPEVQAAVNTIRIHHLANHLRENKQDIENTIVLNQLVQDRRKMLVYLKRKNPEKYFFTIEKLGLTDTSATQEFQLNRNYFARVKFFGENTLPARVTRSDRSEQRKEAKQQKSIAKLHEGKALDPKEAKRQARLEAFKERLQAAKDESSKR
ncbi:37S ribosomal protein S28 [Yarrowia sp. C11]|nr:37S ribosomal protein S28 [Yarrowia sp. E02]KAG5365085.1 37S ribosomal protein S28 [Yarrowia sp. C11]